MFQHFDWDLTHQVVFLYILPSHHMNLRDQPCKMLMLWCRTDICSYKCSAKVSLMLKNPFLVSSLCKLNHISLFFHPDCHKITCKTAYPFRESSIFWSHPRCFGLLRKIKHNIKVSIKTARVSRLSASSDYGKSNCLCN